ncbi:MAG TPA: glutaredoxin family protein [Desulfomonilia bacterium]
MSVNTVEGKDKGKVMLYALSTCGWCKKTKGLLNELGVAYSYTDVDTLTGAERESVMDEVRKWNSACSFPTLVINGSNRIVGFQEDEIRNILK